MTTQLNVQVSCSGAFVSVNTNGGTPPYQIDFYRWLPDQTVWWPNESIASDADGDYLELMGFYIWEGSEQGRVVVTDALGCVAEATTPTYQPFIMRGVSVTGYFPECTTGLNYVRLSILNNTGVAQWTYNVDGQASQLFLSNWTYEGGSSYRSNFTMPNGGHWINFSGFITNEGWQVCPESVQSNSVIIVEPGDCGVNFQLKAALQGPLNTNGVMNDALRVAGLIPLTEPYSALGYTYAGNPTLLPITPASILSVAGWGIIDWVVVELRSATNPATVVYAKPALLDKNGRVLEPDFYDQVSGYSDNNLNFPVPPGNYHIAVRHRNHLGIRTATAAALDVMPEVFDFRSSALACHGTQPRAQVGSTLCLWAGDATGNGALKYTGSTNDRDPILLAVGSTTPNATVTNVYDRRDTNLDGMIKYTGTVNDRDIILTNVGSTTPNNTRTQQLP
jgi:hypothetical protein